MEIEVQTCPVGLRRTTRKGSEEFGCSKPAQALTHIKSEAPLALIRAKWPTGMLKDYTFKANAKKCTKVTLCTAFPAPPSRHKTLQGAQNAANSVV